MKQEDIAYALAKQVPDMHSRGFVIGTSYGDLTIEPGPMAERIATAVRWMLEWDQECTQPGVQRDRLGYDVNAPLMGSGSTRHPDHCQAGWKAQRVDATLCVSAGGRIWDVAHVASVLVGEMVYCQLDRRGDALHVRVGNAQLPDTLALPIGPVHSHLHTPAQIGTPVRSDKPTTPTTTPHQCSCPCAHAAHTPQKPSASNPQAHTHNHKQGTAGAAPGAGSTPSVLVLHVVPLPARRKQGTGKQRGSKGRGSSWSSPKKVR